MRNPLDDRRPAVQATVISIAVSLLAVVLVASAQSGVAMLVTNGQQPMAQTERVPLSVDAAQWNDAPSRTVDLSKQQMAIPYGGGTVDEMKVEALTNETHVGFRLTWEDPTRDTSLDRPNNYSDAAAIMLKASEQPPIMMGGSGDPVNIWYWRASWQYSEHSGDGAGSMYAYPHPENDTRPGEAAGNPLSKAEYGQYGQNYYARGYGSLSNAPTQNVHAEGQRTDDGWQVSFVRERTADGKYDAAFNGSEPLYLAYAVWNGSADEVNGKKSITLRFTKLKSDGSALVAADPGGSSNQQGTPSGGGSGPAGIGFQQYITMILFAMIATWLYSYRKLRGEQR
jgi:DMSO reductase family type II enzyme heme b subunit